MTISNQSSSVTYSGNGVATNFPFGFRVDDEDDLVVTRIVVATEVETVLSQGAYTVNGIGNEGGGSIDITPALSSDYQIRIDRAVPYTQDLDIQNQGGFLPEVLEAQLDRIVMQIQQIKTIALSATGATIVTTGVGVFDTVADATAADIDAGINTIRVEGYSTPGVGAALYKKVVAEPSHVGKINSADGAWWEIAEGVLTFFMFGATGDGATDDITAINNTVSVASALKRKISVTAPADTYAISTSLRIKSNVTLEGDGSRPTIERIGAANDDLTGAVIVNDGLSGAGNTNIHIRGITTKNRYQDFLTPVADSGETIGKMYGIRFGNVTNFSITDCHILDSCAEAIYLGGTSSHLCENGEVCDNYIENAFASAIAITNGNKIQVARNRIKNSRIFGIDVEPNTTCLGTNIVIANNIIDGVEAGYYKNSTGFGESNALGIALSNGSVADQTHHVNIIGNSVRDVQNYTTSGINDFAGIALAAVFSCNVIGNVVDDNEMGGILVRSGCAGITVSGNVVSASEQQGIRVSASTDILVNNNVVKSPATGGIVVISSCTDVMVAGNSVVDPTGVGILVQGATTARVNVNNNNIRDTRAGGSRTLTHGIHLSSGLTDVTVVGNTIDNMINDAIRNVDSPAGVWVISGNNEDGTSRMRMGTGATSLFHAFSDGGIYENQWHRFIARAASGVPNNAIFLDTADNTLKFRNNSGTVQVFTLV